MRHWDSIFHVGNRVFHTRVPCSFVFPMFFLLRFPLFFILKNKPTNPKTPTYGRNHTHFRNKPTNHKNGFGSDWEITPKPHPPMRSEHCRRWRWSSQEEPRSSATEVQIAEEWVRCFWLIWVCCFLLLCWFAFFFVISVCEFVNEERRKMKKEERRTQGKRKSKEYKTRV